MLELNSNHWVIKTYEFLSGNHYEYEKPKSLCGLFWNVILVILTSPFTLFVGLIGLKYNKIKHLTFKERLARLGGISFGYFIMLVVAIGTIETHYGMEYLLSVNAFLLIVVYPLVVAVIFAVAALLVIAIIGVLIKGVEYTQETIESKLVKSNSIDKETKLQFIKGKICPRIKWKDK